MASSHVPCDSAHGRALDSRLALIKRLYDVVFCVSNDRSSHLDENTLAAIHSEVGRIEVLVKAGEEQPAIDEGRGALQDSKMPASSGFDTPPNPPALAREANMPVNDTLPGLSLQQAPTMTMSRAIEIANAAEELASQLAVSVQEFQNRREESDHIHELLITRAEKAAERIICLESGISEMEDDFDANQSELRFLRIQLQAIEARCSQYIPREEDDELSQSIMNWKVDWEDIDRRSNARRMKRSSLLANASASRTAG